MLEAHRILAEREWLERANAIGETLAHLADEGPDGANWLVENPYRPTPDLMIGCGGVLHFLARLSSVGTRSWGMPLMPESLVS